MTKLTPNEIEEYIEEVDPKVKDLVGVVGMTKDQWIAEAIKGPKKLFTRCENCKKWSCKHIENLKEPFPLIINLWYEWGVNCSGFSPNILQNKENVKND